MPTYDLIASSNVTSSVNNVTFSSIPNTYDDLVVHVSSIYQTNDGSSSNASMFIQMNADTGTSYTYRVYAYNSAGNSIQYSNEVTLSTQDSIPSWLTNGLVGYWPFNGNANDESGTGNNGTVTGSLLTIDRFGSIDKAYSFNGNGDIINTTTPFYNAGSNHSICMWFKLTSSNPTQSLFNTNPHVIEGYNINLQANPLNTIGFGLGNGSSWNIANPIGSYFNYLTDLNNWHILTISTSGNNYQFYIDGVLMYSYNCSTLPSNQISNVVFGGTLVGINGGYFTGALDDIRIYNRALSASEVSYLATH
jgi:hypothetical protein